MIPSAGLPDIPTSPAPPGERRETGAPVHWREQGGIAAIDGDTGIGTPQRPNSDYEDIPSRHWRHDYTHDQSMAQEWENDGGRVMVGVHPGFPRGEHEPSLQPQRPTFRTPPSSWTDELLGSE